MRVVHIIEDNMERIEALLESLYASEITEIRYKGRFSRSGLTYWVREATVVLETNKHTHRLEIRIVGGQLLADWMVGDEEIAILQFGLDDDIIVRVNEIIRATLAIERHEENVIVMNLHPSVFWG